jgi:thioredoxin 1
MGTIKLTDKNFDETIKEGITLVDFWAEWCGPCKLLGPVLEEVSEELPNVKIAKLNVDENPEMSAKFGIRSIPTMITFKDGEMVDTISGALPKRIILNKLNLYV